MSNTDKVSLDLTIPFILQIIFIFLKLTDTVGWPWVAVLLPLIVPLIGILLVGIMIVIFGDKFSIRKIKR
jgi:ATP/ADP translocase